MQTTIERKGDWLRVNKQDERISIRIDTISRVREYLAVRTGSGDGLTYITTIDGGGVDLPGVHEATVFDLIKDTP